MVTNQVKLISQNLRSSPGFDRAAAMLAEQEVEREAPTSAWDEQAISRAEVRLGVEAAVRVAAAEYAEAYAVAAAVAATTGIIFGVMLASFALAGVGTGVNLEVIQFAFGIQAVGGGVAAFLAAGARTIRQMR